MTLGPNPNTPYVDKNFVIALLIAICGSLLATGATFAVSTVGSLSSSIASHEARLASIEGKNLSQDALLQQAITELNRRLDRIESKLDKNGP
jgi:hypothetical protein